MTVGELIAELQKHDANKRVLVDGYEGGLCHPKTRTVAAYPTPGAPWYYGPYEEWENFVGPRTDLEDTVVVGR